MPVTPKHWCTKCEKTFTTKRAWRRHMKSVSHLGYHTYKCLLCQRGYSRKDDLYGHLSSQHDIASANHYQHWGLCELQSPNPQMTVTTHTEGDPTITPGEVYLRIEDLTDPPEEIVTSEFQSDAQMAKEIDPVPSPPPPAASSMSTESVPVDLDMDPSDLIQLAATISGILEEDGVCC